MGRWEDAVKRTNTGGGNFMKLADGLNKLRVLTDPVAENKTFASNPGEPRTIFSWVVYNYADKAIQVLSKGATFLKEFDFITETWGDDLPMGCNIVIKKIGQDLNTRYRFQAVPIKDGEELPDDWEKQVKTLDLEKMLPGAIRISEFGKGKDPKPTSIEPNDTQEDDVITDIGDEPINLEDIPF